MHPSRVVRSAARLAYLAAISAVFFIGPTMAVAGARAGLDCQAGEPVEPKSLAFVVAHVERRPAGEFILTFENGEVWQQADLRTKVDIKRGDQVVIRRSTTGSFTLVSRDGQSTRVKRVH
jgi:hypothetical protein